MAKRTRDCPVPKCDGKRKPDEAMCPVCWFSVPKFLRDEVYRTYHAYGAWGDPAVEARNRAITLAAQRFGEAA